MDSSPVTTPLKSYMGISIELASDTVTLAAVEN
jgi:hypothetical protein